jgi:DNA polymerase
VTDGARGPISTWRPGEPVPPEIIEAHADPTALVCAHHDQFERELERRILGPKYDWPIWPIERRRCTQAAALSKALPAGLDDLAAALKLPVRKSAAGKAAMRRLAQPRPKGDRLFPDHDDPKLMEELHAYNRADVEATATIVTQIGLIPPEEQAIWELDAAINQRGVYFDRPLLDAALAIAEQAGEELAAKLSDLTGGEITSAAQTERILEWLAQHGCPLSNLQKPTVAEALAHNDLAPEARQLLELRTDGAGAAVKKLATFRRWLADDGRIRGAFRYWGSSTGRWSSLGCQLQNLRKPEINDVASAIKAVCTGSLDHMETRYERPLEIIGQVTRGLITAAPGHRLFIADLSGIESRGLAWLCNEQGKLDQWREFDRTGKAEDEPYFKIGIEDLQLDPSIARKAGKTADLAYQYQGSIGAYRRLAPAGDTTPDNVILDRRKAWLRRHPAIEKFWRVSVRQAVNAIEHPGERFTVARVAFVYEKPFLRLELPCGRSISYPFARIYQDDDGARSFAFRDASGGRWEWYHTLKKRGVFGGLIAEDATQGLCRDIFAEALLRLETRGYRPVLHLHDEFICEVPNGFGSLDEFRAIIVQAPQWAPDFPVAAKGRIADRFIEGAEKKAAADKTRTRRPTVRPRSRASMTCRPRYIPTN